MPGGHTPRAARAPRRRTARCARHPRARPTAGAPAPRARDRRRSARRATGTPSPSAGPNADPRLGREPARHRERQVGAPEAAREQAHEIEVAEERGAADLREPDAVRRVRRAGAVMTVEPHALGALGLAVARLAASAPSAASRSAGLPPPRSRDIDERRRRRIAPPRPRGAAPLGAPRRARAARRADPRASSTDRTRRRSRSRPACARSGSASARFVWWISMPATLPHGGLARPLSALRYSPSRKPSSSPTSMWSHGSRARHRPRAEVRRDVDAVRRERRASSARGRTPRPSRRTARPPRHTASITSASRRSPRASTPSMNEMPAVVVLERAALSVARPRSCAQDRLLAVDLRLACPARTTATACAAWARAS